MFDINPHTMKMHLDELETRYTQPKRVDNRVRYRMPLPASVLSILAVSGIALSYLTA